MHKLALGAFACAIVLAGCGSNKTTMTTATQAAATTAPVSTKAPTTTSSALQAEATAAATGDIPDNQMFLVFRNAQAGYSMKYPEGWAQSGNGNKVTFRDKNNIVRIEIQTGALPTFAKVKTDLAATQIVSGPAKVTRGGRRATKVTYSTQSSANPVTGKRVTLVVERYYLPHGSKVAIVDLGTGKGVDNVDAYRLMIESFRWK